MNKGFILDGFPRNGEDAKAIFLDAIPEEETNRDHELKDHEGFCINEKTVPQYVVMFEAEDAYLKAKAKEIGALAVGQRQENHSEAQTEKRMKLYREANPSAQDPKHQLAFFQSVIGEPACMLRMVQAPADEKTPQQVEAETLQEIQEFCEQNGKPCCINLITEADVKFLKSLEAPAAKLPADTTQDAGIKSESKSQHGDDATSQQPVEEALDDSNLDEIDLLIRKEEQDASRLAKEAEENSVKEAKAAKEKKIKDDAMAAKMEDIRKQERDLLDQRSQPIRQYLMDNVVPHLTEGLIELCKKVPEDAIDHLANFLLERADLIDEQHIKKREEEIRLK